MLRFLAILCFIAITAALAANKKLKVLVTGAAGRTGSFVFKKLLQDPSFEPVALVRTPASGKKLQNQLKISESQVVVGDITNEESLKGVYKGCDATILCTSAVPKINVVSIVKASIGKLFGKAIRPTFTFPNGDPYVVDWIGAKNQIDAAKAAGLKQFVFLSSMGGTQPENFLNTIGKRDGDEKSGNILLWKRKAEEYLIASGLPYTIIHPGGLTDKKGGESEVLMGFDDKFLTLPTRNIPREDVADVCVQALKNSKALKKSFDIIAKPVADGGKLIEDWGKFFSLSGTNKY